MRRRILSMFLAILLVVALALNVSAAYDWKEIGGEQYYFTLNCYETKANGKTESTSQTALLGVELMVYSVSGVLMQSTGTYNKTYTASAALSISGNPGYATSEHYVNGVCEYNSWDSAS